MNSSLSGKLVRRDRNFYFVGSHRREVIFSVSAENMEEALQKFQSSPHATTEILFVIKTETEPTREIPEANRTLDVTDQESAGR